jgi:hypothetical protein
MRVVQRGNSSVNHGWVAEGVFRDNSGVVISKVDGGPARIMAQNANYDLAERLSSANGIATYRAILKSTGEVVFVHELPRGTAEMYDLARKHFCSSSIDKPILDLYTIDGISYVVTRPQQSTIPLREWLTALPLESQRRETSQWISRGDVDSPGVQRGSDSLKWAVEGNMATSGETPFGRAADKTDYSVVSGRPAVADRGYKNMPIESPRSSLDAQESPLPAISDASRQEEGDYTRYWKEAAAGRGATLKPNADDHSTADVPGREPSSPFTVKQKQEARGTFTEVFPAVDCAPPVSEKTASNIRKDDEEGNFAKFFPPDSGIVSSPAPQEHEAVSSKATPDDKPPFGDSTAIFRNPLDKSPISSQLAGEYTQIYDRRSK